jgi:uncharacterized cupredoxin-like copper-binding protein
MDMHKTILPFALAGVLVLGACASNEPVAPAAEPPMHQEDEGEGTGGHAEEMFAFGEPGDPASADRVVEVTTTDGLRFEPSSIDVAAGETISFVVSNPGQVPHEFVIGDQAFQVEHAEEMAGGVGMMHGEPNLVSVDAGETKELTWTFSTAMEGLEFGCHVPGHYEAGMVGQFPFSA